MKPKIAIIISHPIQHFVPLYISYSENTNFEAKVFFASKSGVNAYFDKQFGREVKWANLKLDFEHEFLNNGNVLPVNLKLDAPCIEQKLDSYKPNYIIQYGYTQKLQRRVHKWAIKNKKPIIHFSDSELRHKRKWYNKILKRLFLPKFYSKISVFLTTGDANEAYYRNYGVPDFKFIKSPYPIDFNYYEQQFFTKDALNIEIREKYNIPDSNVICSVVGKLVSWKSQNHIIQALKLLEKKQNNITILIIGSGEKYEMWKNEAKQIQNNQVIFTGFVEASLLPKYYAATDIYIHSAFIEPHSVAISEAIYMGCPVIISDKCGSYGSSDDVRIGRNGFVYKYGNIDKLAKFIEYLVNNKGLRERMAVEARKIAVMSQKMSHYEGIESALLKLKGNNL